MAGPPSAPRSPPTASPIPVYWASASVSCSGCSLGSGCRTSCAWPPAAAPCARCRSAPACGATSSPGTSDRSTWRGRAVSDPGGSIRRGSATTTRADLLRDGRCAGASTEPGGSEANREQPIDWRAEYCRLYRARSALQVREQYHQHPEGAHLRPAAASPAGPAPLRSADPTARSWQAGTAGAGRPCCPLAHDRYIASTAAARYRSSGRTPSTPSPCSPVHSAYRASTAGLPRRSPPPRPGGHTAPSPP